MNFVYRAAYLLIPLAIVAAVYIFVDRSLAQVTIGGSR